MHRSMLTLTLPLCGLLFGFAGPPEDGEPPQGSEVAEEDTQVTPAEETEGTASSRKIYSSRHPGSTVIFNTFREVFHVTDTTGNGRLAVAQIWNLTTNQYHYCANRREGTTHQCVYNWPEGQWLHFRACTSDEGFLNADCKQDWTGANTAN